jgi:aryl-alcohol dehydrogenase
MKIEAAVSREGAPFPVIEAFDLAEPRPNEVMVRIVASGICHTDLGVHSGRGMQTPKPVVLGHEGAGVIERVGAAVAMLKAGDHVVLSGASCGRCSSCQRNLPSYCAEMVPRNFGGQRVDGSTPLSQGGERIGASFFGQSSFSTHVVADERSAVKMPDDVPLDILGPLGCGVITGSGAVINSFGLGAGQTIAVFGAGGVGLSAVMAARLAGAAKIVAVDPVATRRALALELGATDAVDPAVGDPAKAIREIVPYGVDFSFNTTTVPAVYTQALDCLAMRGMAGFVTAPRGEWAPPMYPMLAGGRTMKGILGGDAKPSLFLPMLVEYWRQGRFPFDRLITFYPFEKIAEAFQDTAGGKTIKPVLRMAV